ncbi:hypothetical protein PPERSA_06299 [Pseudocohnilembus persalinus]|uniref:Uncharacterized protein n=1 Tax=Pseudocohnilembus persalinus TaxID=266149 RepID=A0A0V0QJ38_PSEPJ|nr:hypothetical protein PPERSA_06299 [Pseudocohnilembus persalinus]|eukprot:KRX02104.1 hypothetical protein PPERSA_06299 [Pseudocohnilembus persalinus]
MKEKILHGMKVYVIYKNHPKAQLNPNNSSELGLNSQFKNPSNRQTSQSVASDFYSQKENKQQQINANNNEFCINKKQNLDGVIFDPSVIFENERFDEKYITTQVLNLDYQTKYNYFLQNQLDFKGYEIEFNQFINQLQPDPNLQKKYQQLAYGGY